MSDEFDQLLAETGITFVPPAGFSPFPVRTSCAFRYQRAYRHATGVELRLRIDSLQRIRAQLNGFLPGNLSETAFVSGITNLGGGKASVYELEADKARQFFNADWVRGANFKPVDPQFAPDHEWAIVHYYHRENIADVYLIALSQEGDGMRLVMMGTEPPLRYPEFAPNAAPAREEAFSQLLDKAAALIDGCISLAGRRLPAPNDDERRRMEEAIPLFEQAAALEPRNAGPALFIGKIHERLGDLRASLASLRRGHSIVPDNSVLILELGRTLGRCGLHGEAIEILSPGSSMHPRHPAIHLNLGVSLLLSGNARRAIPVFEKLVELEPQRPDNKKLLAVASDIADGRTPVPKTEDELVALL